MLKLAKENANNENFEAMKGSSEKIPLENDSADIIVSRFSLTYWKEPRQSFEEIYRVLKHNGKVILELLNKDFPKSKLFAIKINMKFKGASSDIIRYHIDAYKRAYTIETVSKLLTKTNFKITYKEGDKKDWKFIIVAKKL